MTTPLEAQAEGQPTGDQAAFQTNAGGESLSELAWSICAPRSSFVSAHSRTSAGIRSPSLKNYRTGDGASNHLTTFNVPQALTLLSFEI